MGNCVYHVAAQGNYSYQKPTRNGELEQYTQAIYHARELAMDRMQAEAINDGATGIIGVKFTEQARHWDKQVFEFLAVGTSVTQVDTPATAPAMALVGITISLDDR